MANDLYIKYYPQDSGSRPIANCGQAAPWPWMSSSTTMTDLNGNVLAKARVGQACIIHVQADSSGATYPASPVPPKVQVWVCDYTLGVGPGSVRQYSGSIDEFGKTASVISKSGSSTNSVAKGAPGVAKIHWTPQPGDLRNVNAEGEAHMCIGANTYFEGPANPGAEGAPMPPPDFLDICGNQHHAQLNIAIQPAAVDPTPLPIQVWRGGGEEEFDIDIRPARAYKGRVLGLAELERIAVLPSVTLRQQRGTRIARDREGVPIEPIERSVLRRGGELLVDGDPLKVSRREMRLIELEDPRGKQRGKHIKVKGGHGKRPQAINVSAAFDERERPGAVRAFDIRQMRGNALFGAARVVFIKAPR